MHRQAFGREWIGSCVARLLKGCSCFSFDPGFGYQSFWRDEFPGGLDMKRQVLLADAGQFDADPTADAHVRWLEVRFGVSFNKCRLKTRRHRNPYGNMTIIVVIVSEHHEYLSSDKEGRLAVRGPLGGFRKDQTYAAYTFQLFMAHDICLGLSPCMVATEMDGPGFKGCLTLLTCRREEQHHQNLVIHKFGLLFGPNVANRCIHRYPTLPGIKVLQTCIAIKHCDIRIALLNIPRPGCDHLAPKSLPAE